ncbi:Exodeoxyribonuclease I [Gammaproteobacteria bacterium]
MQKTYLFYDIETSGLNKCFDQVLQFAAIRTDLELNELERHEILIKLNPDTVPSPQAILVHQLTFEQLKMGMCEYEAMREIHQLFNTPGTITVGYNTLGFDDEFLRFSFYRNLLTPYTHQYANNCSRMDLYPITAMYYLFKPSGITWPKIAEKTTLKLEHLSLHNKLANGKAHDAMTDVEATLALARLLRKAREMWDYLCGYFDKKIDLERLAKLTFVFGEYRQALLVDGSFGVEKFYQCPVLGLGMHNHYKNQSLWLPLDSPSLVETALDSIPKTTFIYRKRFAEQPLLLPLSKRFDKYLSDNRRELIASNVDWLQRNPQILSEIVRYHKEYKYPEVPNLDVDAALYQNGFLKDTELQLCNCFHLASLPEKVELIKRFTNPSLRNQAIRVLGRNYPEVLSDNYHQEFINYLNKIKSGGVIIDYRSSVHASPEVVLAEIKQLQDMGNLSTLQFNLLEGLSKNLSFENF